MFLLYLDYSCLSCTRLVWAMCIFMDENDERATRLWLIVIFLTYSSS